MAQIALDGVSKEYEGRVLAVDGVSLTVHDGEFLVLIGPSGCGKSTTLRLVAGLERLTAGEVRIDGRVVNELPPRRRNIAMVFQSQVLFPHLTVAENIAFGWRLREGGWWRRYGRRWFSRRRTDGNQHSSTEIGSLVRAAAKRLGVEQMLDRRPWQLSGGQRQRVALGQAIVRQPVAFLFDEPLASLDASLRSELRGELKRLHGQLGTTTIYVTHDQSEAMMLGDRVAVMDQGRLHQVAAPRELYDRPNSRRVAAMLGDTPMNFVEGTIIADGVTHRFQTDGWAIGLTPAAAQRACRAKRRGVVLGIRPENVGVGPQEKRDKNTPAPPMLNVGGTVSLVEFTGDAQIVHVALPSSEGASAAIVRGKAAGDCLLRPGDASAVGFDVERAVWFDCDSGANLETV